ncbi:hypothetical protein [Cupriavidus sp. IDO]|uniref:hypothetical protein n=1 Tax=Cupriavidus sp. IDO TaxID=1539142 RepID=UPI0005796BEF|nr:hypothetical protein [Cupriavidus sp. IDO]KWR88781.1 hypothetical protein RM96_17865 [Cupriavidus sp. IDO]
MVITYSSITTWSRVTTALRVFVVTVAEAVTDTIRYFVSKVVDWARSVVGKPAHLALADTRPMAGLNARETFHLRAAKRGRPVVMPRWRMCASV